MLPTPGDVHVNAPLTNVSIAYSQASTNFVAAQAFPTVPVDKKTDIYWSFPKDYWRRAEMEKRGPGTPAKRIGYAVDRTNTYNCDVWAIAKDIEDQVRANADAGLDQERIATKLLMQQALLRREIQFATNFLTTGWGTDLTGVAGVPGAGQFQQWDQTSSTPLEDVALGCSEILRRTGMMANTLVIDYPVWRALKNHPDIVDRIKYGQLGAPGNPAIVTQQAVAALMELERILVMKGSRTNQAEGAAAADANEVFIGGKDSLLMYVSPTPALEAPSAGYTFVWRQYLAGADGQRVKRYRQPEMLASDSVEIEMAFDMKRVAVDCGYFFNGTVA